MACRCNEISRCEQDIALLSGEVAQKLNNVRANYNATMSKYTTLSGSLAKAITIDNIDKVIQRFAAIKKQHEGNMESLQSKRSGELSRVKSRMESYKNEDRRYHAMTTPVAGK